LKAKSLSAKIRQIKEIVNLNLHFRSHAKKILPLSKKLELKRVDKALEASRKILSRLSLQNIV
jgi:hypothetical protein